MMCILHSVVMPLTAVDNCECMNASNASVIWCHLCETAVCI